jgi:alpha-tubulin suppressor-like RCC1 family protein
MVTSLKNLKTEIDDRLAEGGLTALACCQLQNAETILDNNIVTSVANTASLPCNALNEGRFVYVEDIKEYRLANDVSWTDDVSSEICIYQRQIWTWGDSGCGRLSAGVTRCSPAREHCSATDWSSVSSSNYHSIALKTSGQIWGWGQNIYGQLGNGGVISSGVGSPVREFCSATDWCTVKTGERHTLAVKTSGELWAWGAGNCGQLGFGGIAAGNGLCSPVREFCSATDWCQVSPERRHSGAVKTTGQIWVWGDNVCGRLGDGTTTNRCSPVREYCSATDWCQLSITNSGGVAIKTTGQLWAWGRGTDGILGDGTTTDTCSPVQEICSATDWCQVSSGYHTAAIKTSGELWSWGRGGNGQLGDGTATNRCSPVREICSATDWCALSVGHFHSIGIKTSGELWAWGNNGCGQLGDGTITNRCSPVREFCNATDWCQAGAGRRHTAAVKAASKGFLE